MVDDEGVDGAFGGLELEAELVLDGGKDGNDIGATLLGGDVIGPFESDVGVAGEAGLVVDLAVASSERAAARSAMEAPLLVRTKLVSSPLMFQLLSLSSSWESLTLGPPFATTRS